MSVATSTSHAWFSLRSVCSLAWQQLKATSALRWSTLLATVLIQWAIPFVGSPTRGSGLVLLPLLTFALVGPAVSLAQECEMRTRSRLLMLPVSWLLVSTVLVAQLLAQLLGMTAVAALNWYLVRQVASIPFEGGLLEALAHNSGTAPSFVFWLLVVAISAGLFGATLGRRSISAIGLGTALFLGVMVFALSQEQTGSDFAPLGLGATVVLAGLNIFGLRRWFHRAENATAAIPIVSVGRCPDRYLQSQSRSRAWQDLRLLVWHERRRSLPWVCVGILFGAVMLANHLTFDIAGLVFGTMFGLLAFRNEQADSRFRFLRDRGLSPSVVWLSRQAVWFPWLVCLNLAYAAVLFAIARPRIGQDTQTILPMSLALSMVAYSVGQLCLLASRRFHVAIGLAVGCGCAIYIWTHLTCRLYAVPAVVSMGPLLTGVLLASWLTCRRWLDERATAGRIVSTLAITAVASYAMVSAFRVFEIPTDNEYVSNAVAMTKEAEPKRLVRTNEARANAKRLLHISRRLIDRDRFPVGPTFCRIDRSPVGWGELDDATRQWATVNTDAVEESLKLLERSDFFFSGANSGGATTVQPKQLVGLPAAITEIAHNWASAFDLYAPMFLLELHGVKAEADGDFARAATLYQAAIRGYWRTLSSERPDSDVLTVYPAAGHVFRRLGRLSASIVDSDPAVARRLRDDISRLATERPSLHDINDWQRELAISRPLGEEPTRPFEFAFVGERRAHSHRWLARPFGQTSPIIDSVPDVFTLGERRNRLVQWRHSRQRNLLAVYERVQQSDHPRREWIQGLDANWLVDKPWQQFMASTPSFYPLLAESPVHWIYADLDLRTDINAAKCLAKLAADLQEGKPLTVLFGPDFERTTVWELGRDPWQGKPFLFHPEGLSETTLDSMNNPIPAGTPLLVGVGSPPQQAYKFEYDPNILAGGPRYYVLPDFVQNQIRQRRSTGESSEKSD